MPNRSDVAFFLAKHLKLTYWFQVISAHLNTCSRLTDGEFSENAKAFLVNSVKEVANRVTTSGIELPAAFNTSSFAREVIVLCPDVTPFTALHYSTSHRTFIPVRYKQKIRFTSC